MNVNVEAAHKEKVRAAFEAEVAKAKAAARKEKVRAAFETELAKAAAAMPAACETEEPAPVCPQCVAAPQEDAAAARKQKVQAAFEAELAAEPCCCEAKAEEKRAGKSPLAIVAIAVGAVLLVYLAYRLLS